jgi:hypothetical protein
MKDKIKKEELEWMMNYTDNSLDEIFSIICLLRNSAKNDDLCEWTTEKTLNGVLSLIGDIQEYIEQKRKTI